MDRTYEIFTGETADGKDFDVMAVEFKGTGHNQWACGKHVR